MTKQHRKPSRRTESNLITLTPTLLTPDMMAHTLITTEYVSIIKAISILWSLIVEDDLINDLWGDISIEIYFTQNRDTAVILNIALMQYTAPNIKRTIVKYNYPIRNLRNMTSVTHLVKSKFSKGYFKGNDGACNYTLKYKDPYTKQIIHVESTFIDRQDDYKPWFTRSSEYSYVAQNSGNYPPLVIGKINFSKIVHTDGIVIGTIRRVLSTFITGIDSDNLEEGIMSKDKLVWYID